MGSFCSTGYGHATRSGKSGNNISPLRHSSSHARSIEVTPINTGHVIFKTTQIVLNRVLSLQEDERLKKLQAESGLDRSIVDACFKSCQILTNPSDKQETLKFLKDNGIGNKLTHWIVEKMLPRINPDLHRSFCKPNAPPEKHATAEYEHLVYDLQFTVCWLLITVLSTLNSAHIGEQISFFFDLFDLNGDGMLQFNELVLFIEALHEQQRLDGMAPDISPESLVAVLLLEADENGDGCLSLEELMSHSKFIATKLRLQWRVENCHPGYPLGRKLSAAQVPYADSELIITEHEEKSTSASETENQKPTKSI